MFLQSKTSWKLKKKADKAIFLSYKSTPQYACLLAQGYEGGLSILNPTCNWGRHTGKSCNSTPPTLQSYYRRIIISILHSKSIFNGPLGPIYCSFLVCLVNECNRGSLSSGCVWPSTPHADDSYYLSSYKETVDSKMKMKMSIVICPRQWQVKLLSPQINTKASQQNNVAELFWGWGVYNSQN